MLEINVNQCTRCNKKFTDIVVAVKLDIEVFRFDESSVPEQIANLDQESREFMCKECFDDFAAVLEQMNLPADKHEELIQEREENCECNEPGCGCVEPDKKIVEDCSYDE